MKRALTILKERNAQNVLSGQDVIAGPETTFTEPSAFRPDRRSSSPYGSMRVGIIFSTDDMNAVVVGRAWVQTSTSPELSLYCLGAIRNWKKASVSYREGSRKDELTIVV